MNEERLPRRFVLERAVDMTGVSGTGTVVEGVQFTDGRCAIRWRGPLASTTEHDSVDNVVAIHGHNGSTTLRWLD